MSFVAAGTFVVGSSAAASMGALATGLIGGALVGAGAGALYNGVTGRSVLNGALYGGLIGGAGGALGGAFAGPGLLSEGALASADALAIEAGFPTAAYAMQVGGMSPAALGLPASTTAEALMASSAALTQSGAGATAGQALSGANTLKNAAGAEQNLNAPVNPYAVNPTTQTAPLSAYDPMQASQEGYSLPLDKYDPMQASQEGFSLPGATGGFRTNDASSFGEGWSSKGFNGGPSEKNAISGYLDQAGNWISKNKGLTAAGVGLGAYLLSGSGKSLTSPTYLPDYQPVTASSMGLNRTLSSNYKPYKPMAEGGIASLMDSPGIAKSPNPPTPGLMDNASKAHVDFMGQDMYPQSQMYRDYYATPTQMPMAAQQAMAAYEPNTNPLTGQTTTGLAGGGLTAAGQTGLVAPTQQMDPIYIQQLASQFNTTPAIAQQGLNVLQTAGIAKASGGSVGSKYNLGSYSDGGRLLKGPGDGMSDHIPATIANKQPARLADGEFVVPADVVSHLGNGSTDAGAKHLYKMMDNVRKARTGRKSQGKQIKAGKYLPK